jgi:UDP-galactopyranose mutase
MSSAPTPSSGAAAAVADAAAESFDIVIVGAGLSGATIAERCASVHGWRVLVLDKRDHIGGNVYDSVDAESGIRVSKYGAHIFHTNDEGVWSYVQNFARWRRWDHRVVSSIAGRGLVPVPVNTNTINALFDTSLRTEAETEAWLAAQQVRPEGGRAPADSREMALSRVGPDLYELLFRPYTVKQWAKDPSELDASVLARIPVRSNFDDRYFSDKYQALPADGYTAFAERLLAHPNITVRLNTPYVRPGNAEGLAPTPVRFTRALVYTGPIDAYFSDAGLPRLEYRSIHFAWERHATPGGGYFQPCSVVNHPSTSVPYTRIVEYKHFLAQPSEQTLITKETSTDEGEPYYPVPNPQNQALYERYRALADEEEARGGVHFLGRLASYKYFNMDQAIR